MVPDFVEPANLAPGKLSGYLEAVGLAARPSQAQ